MSTPTLPLSSTARPLLSLATSTGSIPSFTETLNSSSTESSSIRPLLSTSSSADSVPSFTETLNSSVNSAETLNDDSFRPKFKVSKILYGETTPLPPPGVNSLPSLFAYQASRRPHAPFLTFYDGTNSTCITYGEAYQRSRDIARGLAIHKPKVVAVWYEKSLDLHLAILGVTQCASWLPFDPDAPVQRVTACLTDSEAEILLCDRAHRDKAEEAVKGLKTKVLMLEDLDGAGDIQSPGPQDIAYMIYTSGSTGTPKGIEISQFAAVTFATSERTILMTDENDVVWQGFSPAFDMFIEEVWVSIAGGAHLVVGSREVCQDVANLGNVWSAFGVTVVNAVPTMINIMVSLGNGVSHCVRLVNLGGEACPPSLVKRLWRPDLTLVNTYGPTETTVTATYDILYPDSPVTIGRPLPWYHVSLLPLDGGEPLDLVPGTEGQLCIGGPCLGRGYVKRSELTAEKFMPHPLIPGERLYQTGDRVRIGQDGRIHFLGRIDTQVKHRGFRIELAEIEAVISTHPDVQVAAVICARAGEDNARLEAYIVLNSGVSAEFHLATLPSYMHPEAYFFLKPDEMPRLPSGKINLKGLAELSENQTVVEKTYDGPLGVLLTAMAAVFPQAQLHADSDFFDDLGGHSLTAAILVSRLRKESGSLETLGLGDIYQLRTPRAIAEKYFEKAEHVSEPVAYHPVNPWRHCLCGFAQIPPLIFFAFIHAVILLAPYFVFAQVYASVASIPAALGAALACFVVFPPLLLILGLSGKWLFLGRAKAGEYPLYGLYYYRWWLAGRFTDLIDHKTWGELSLYPVLLRTLGAKIGKHCHLGAMATGPCLDMVTIGDDVVVGKDVVLNVSCIERGLLVIKPVKIGDEANIGSQSVIDGGATVSAAAELAPMSMVADGVVIPSCERWHGSPAQYQSPSLEPYQGRLTRPSTIRYIIFNACAWLLGSLMMPVLWIIPQIPGLWLFLVVQLPEFSGWSRTAILAVPTSISFIIFVFLEMVVVRRILLPKLEPDVAYGVTSSTYLRKWLVDRTMDMSLVVLHPVYATLYVVPYLRALGVKIGRGAEVSNARGFTYDLTEIGEEAFVADNVRLGDVTIRANSVTFQRTSISARAFSGNSSLLPQGTHLQPNTLVGVLSIAPEKPLIPGESCFGSPPVRMPQRQAAPKHDAKVLYRPTKRLIAERLFIEGCRIWLPRAIIVFAIGFTVQIFTLIVNTYGALPALLLLPVYEIVMFCLPAFIVTVTLKWILIGRYKPADWPLWSRNVWFSEACTSTAESLIAPLFLVRLVGTPLLPFVMRMLGANIGKRCTMMSFDLTEWDMVNLGDEAVLNAFCGPQTHLFEDRVMKVGPVTVESRATLKPYTICLPNSRVGQGSQLDSLSLLMKGESVPANQRWQGAPVMRRATNFGIV